MSRMTTSRASLLRARSAMRRAWARGVRWSKARFRGRPQRSSRRARWSTVSVEAELGNQPRHPGRDESADRLAAGHAVSDLARGDRDGRDVEELDAVGPLERGEHGVER